jgi:RHS repeat-associated protein
VDGSLLGTYGRTNGPFRGESWDVNVYFAGRQIWQAATLGGPNPRPVSPDRLGSAVKHFPYGDEPTAIGQDSVKFATYYRDQITALDYARNRYYSSTIARFTTADPYGGSARPDAPQTWNRYSYVGGDPVNRNDPSGLDSYCWSDSSGFRCYTETPGPDPNVELYYNLWSNAQGIFYDDWQRNALLDYWAQAQEYANNSQPASDFYANLYQDRLRGLTAISVESCSFSQNLAMECDDSYTAMLFAAATRNPWFAGIATSW